MKSNESGASAPAPAHRRRRKWLLALLLAPLLGVIALRVVLPGLIRGIAVRALSNERVELSVGSVALRLGEARLVADRLRLRGVVSGKDLAAAARLDVDLEWAGLFDGFVKVEKAALLEPEFFLAYDAEGQLNWDLLSSRAEQEGEDPSEPAPPFDVHVAEFELGAGVVRLSDESEDGLPELTLSMGTVRLEGFALGRPERGGQLVWGLHGIDATEWTFEVIDSETQVDFAIEASAGPVEPGGSIPFVFSGQQEGALSLDITGEVAPDPFQATAHIEWRDLPSRGVLYSLAAQGARIEKGMSDGVVDLDFSLAPGPNRGLIASGRARHRGLAMEGVGEADLRIAVEDLLVELRELRLPVREEEAAAPERIQVRLARVEVVAPTVEGRLPTPEEVEERIATWVPAEPDDAGDAPISLELDSLSLREGNVSWSDPVSGPDEVQRLTRIEIRSKGLRWSIDEPAATASADAASLRASWKNVHSRTIARLFEIEGYRVEDGRSDGDVAIELLTEVDGRSALEIRGNVLHHDLRLVNTEEEELRIEAPRMSAKNVRMRVPGTRAPSDAPEPIEVSVEAVEIESPLVSLPLSKTGDGEAPQQADATPQASAAEGEVPADIRIDTLTLTDGKLRWRDSGTDPNRATHIGAIELRAQSVRWPGLAFQNGSLVLGSVGVEPLRLEGSVEPGHGDLELSGRRIAIAPWNDLITSRSSFSVIRGEVSVTAPLRLRGRTYDSRIQLRIRDIEMSSRNQAFRQTFGMPLARAIPLLTDSAGVIRLEIPVRGTLGEGTAVAFVKVFNHALREASRNAIASSLAVGVDTAGATIRRVRELVSGGIGEVVFRPGSSQLGRGADSRMQVAIGLLAERRQSRLRLVARIVTDDLRALELDDRGRGRRLVGAIGETGRALLGGSRELDSEDQEHLQDLAGERLDAVERALVERGVSADRIQRTPWDGRVFEGGPGVMLRLDSRAE